MTKKIKKEKLNDIVMAIFAITADKTKNAITLRCEKIAKEIDVISRKLNEEILEINTGYASTDKNGNLLHEEVITNNGHGSSKTENSGGYKYTISKDKERKEAIQKFWSEDIDIPVSIVKRNESNTALYKQIIEKHNFTQLSNLAGIILDIPVDAEGFIDEGWVLGFLEGKDETKEKQNGQADKKELTPAPQD